MSKLNDVINRLEDECEKNKTNQMMRIVCNHVNEKLSNQPDNVLDKILNENLTISSAIDEMKKEAQKNAVGGCGILTDEEGFEIIDSYFGLNGSNSQSNAETKKTVSLFDLI